MGQVIIATCYEDILPYLRPDFVIHTQHGRDPDFYGGLECLKPVVRASLDVNAKYPPIVTSISSFSKSPISQHFSSQEKEDTKLYIPSQALQIVVEQDQHTQKACEAFEWTVRQGKRDQRGRA